MTIISCVRNCCSQVVNNYLLVIMYTFKGVSLIVMVHHLTAFQVISVAHSRSIVDSKCTKYRLPN